MDTNTFVFSSVYLGNPRTVDYTDNTDEPTFPCEANDLNNKNDERIAKGYVSLNYNPNFLSHGFTQIKHRFSGGSLARNTPGSAR